MTKKQAKKKLSKSAYRSLSAHNRCLEYSKKHKDNKSAVYHYYCGKDIMKKRRKLSDHEKEVNWFMAGTRTSMR